MLPDLTQRIKKLDTFFESKRPSSIESGRIIYSDTADGLYEMIEGSKERLATVREVMVFRVESFRSLYNQIPGLNEELNELINQRYELAGPVLEELNSNSEKYGIWGTRLTTSTHMVRADDANGKDTVFFYDGNLFTGDEICQALKMELSDGGFKYSPEALHKVRQETPSESRLPFNEYMQAKGGNFSGEEWASHPIFKTACSDEKLMEDYVFALQVLDLFSFYNPGKHSGWRPGEMKKEYGRPVSLGFKGEAFYPPNNSTLDHAALVLSEM